jgi:MFS family permease
VAPLLGIINNDIGPDPNYVWIALVYILTLAIGQVLVGRLSDLFGRRWFFILGSVSLRGENSSCFWGVPGNSLASRSWETITNSLVTQLLALLGCVISAVATSINMLIGGTVLVGFAAASQLSYVFVVGELIPFKHRFLSMTFLYSWAVPFSGFGPAIAYQFVQHTKHTWRSCYYLMIGVNALAVICWVLL